MTTTSTSRVLCTLACALVLSGAGGTSAGTLSATQRDGYLVWLHSLEQTVAGRTSAGADEQRLLFPYDEPPPELERGTARYRQLAIGRAVKDLEQRRRPRHEGPLAALTQARNYVRLAEYDSALSWYGAARRADRAGSLAEEVARETLATALAADDSAAAARAVDDLLQAGVPEARADEAVLAVRWLLVTGDSGTLDRLLTRVATLPSPVPPRLEYWRARALSWLGRRAACLDALLELVVAGRGRSLGLDEDERAWALRAVPDLLLLEGHEAEARDLYERLALSSLADLAAWGRYQVAGLDLAAARYEEAAAGFALVCDGQGRGAWQKRARALRDLARTLERIRREGEPYGIAAFYRR